MFNDCQSFRVLGSNWANLDSMGHAWRAAELIRPLAWPNITTYVSFLFTIDSHPRSVYISITWSQLAMFRRQLLTFQSASIPLVYSRPQLSLKISIAFRSSANVTIAESMIIRAIHTMLRSVLARAFRRYLRGGHANNIIVQGQMVRAYHISQGVGGFHLEFNHPRKVLTDFKQFCYLWNMFKFWCCWW